MRRPAGWPCGSRRRLPARGEARAVRSCGDLRMTRPFKPYPFAPRRHPAAVPPLVDGRDPRTRAVAIARGGRVAVATNR
ncbi:hypothetical protein OKW43_002090 [Paraburkholderia sp. WC7.3g]